MPVAIRGVAGIALVAMLATAGHAGTPPTPEQAFRPCRTTPIEQIALVDFVAYFPTEQDAVEMAARVDDALFDVVVRAAADRPDWVLRATYRELPEAATHAANERELPALAAAHGGRHAGFGCFLEPRRR
jgi:hypothetical protein